MLQCFELLASSRDRDRFEDMRDVAGETIVASYVGVVTGAYHAPVLVQYSLIPRLLPRFYLTDVEKNHSWEIKSGSGLGTRLYVYRENCVGKNTLSATYNCTCTYKPRVFYPNLPSTKHQLKFLFTY